MNEQINTLSMPHSANPDANYKISNAMRTANRIVPNYACPRTHSPLHFRDGALYAEVGTGVYPIRSGIPQFLCFESVEDADTKASLERLSQLARENGWQSALAQVYCDNKGMVRYVTERGRASFVGLLPISKDTDVLEIGPGLGQFTSLLAHRARSVCALEVVPGQAEFAAERCKQEGEGDVHFATGGDDCRLPFGKESFDVVVLNLVFEWCATRCVGESFSDVQRRFLDEISRVLRPGGSLYLATKNRFSLRNLLGRRDSHCHDIRFGSVLPRFVASILMRIRGHSRPAGMLYSHTKLQAMLCNAGFEQIQSYWATPEMRFPSHMVKTDADSIRAARRAPGFVQGEGRYGILMRWIPAPLVKYFTPGLAFLATKGR